MAMLLAASFIWAFSFGLIKNYLGGLDAGFISAVRLALSFLLFLPLLRPRLTPPSLAARLLALGAMQFGLMYVFYTQSFRYLAAHQVALFTVLTPLYVAAAADLLEGRLRPLHLWTALMAAAGSAVIVYAGMGGAGLLAGFLLVQASNLCFALGQVLYRRLAPPARGWRDRDAFAWLYLGGAAAAALAMLLSSAPPLPALGGGQWLVLAYLGLLASGVGFFLWNVGALGVSAGMLAVFNNVKIPLAILVSLVFFGEQADLPRLGLGGALILAALALNSRRRRA